MFEKGNYVELSFGGVSFEVLGCDELIFGGCEMGDVVKGYGFVGLVYKYQFNDNLLGVFIMEQFFGVDVVYNLVDLIVFGGMQVEVNLIIYIVLLCYKFDNNFLVYGGICGLYVDGNVILNGVVYGVLLGYNVDFDGVWGVGWVVGVVYEIFDIVVCILLIYNLLVEYDFDMIEMYFVLFFNIDSEIMVKMLCSWVLEGQIGVVFDMLVFGLICWVKWFEFWVNFVVLVGMLFVGFGVDGGLVELDNMMIYIIGVGCKFIENWLGLVLLIYEFLMGDDFVLLLVLINGCKGILLVVIYMMDNIKIIIGVSYMKLGDVLVEIGMLDVVCVKMEGNDFWGVGVCVGYFF